MVDTRRKSFKQCVRLFSPAWFTVIMGTGTVSVLAANFHFGYGSSALTVITLVFFFVNLASYIVICAITIARYYFFPELWRRMLYEPKEGLFVGAFPIGSATLLNVSLIINQRWDIGGNGFMYAIWGLWWVVLAVAYTTAFGMLYVLSASRHHLVSETTSIWVLPIIPLIALSATGGLLSQALLPHSASLTLLTVSFSLVSFCIGMSLSLMVITLFLTRLVLRSPPPPRVVMSGFIVVSPFGQGGYSLLVNGKTLGMMFPSNVDPSFPPAPVTGEILFVICFAGSCLLWCMGLSWIVISLSSIYAAQRSFKAPFALAYWGVVFPNGVFALCSVQLGVVLNSKFFHYFGAIWSIIVLFLWVMCAFLTVRHLIDTSIFVGLPGVEYPSDSESRMTGTATFDF